MTSGETMNVVNWRSPVVKLTAILCAVLVIAATHFATKGEDPLVRQAKAQEQMAQELNQIKQILGSWDWEKGRKCR
jgi:anti-sigma-K factor RskA